MIARILVALSGTPYTPIAIQYAIELAKLHASELTGVTVTDIKRLAYVGSVPMGAISVATELEEQRIHITEERVEEAIAAFEAECRASDVTHRIDRETGDPLDELISLWRYHDLTIFGLRGLFEYGVVKNPDDALIGLIKHGIRPILAVGSEHRPVKRVLIAYNGSLESSKAMKQFVQLRLWPEVSVRIACFNRKPDVGRPLLDDAASYCLAHGMDVETELVDANPKSELIGYANDWDAHLIVMGSTSRMRILKHVMGDTVLTAIRESSVPLFLTQ